MENNSLTYYSIIYEFLSNSVEQIDITIAEADDGQPMSVRESKAEAITFLDELIEEINKLKSSIQDKTISAIKKEHGIE